MKKLCIDVKPLSFTYPGLIYDTDTKSYETISITTGEPSRIADYALEHDIDCIELYGNRLFNSNIKMKLERELNRQIVAYENKAQIPVEIKGVMK